jgi:hypothetical protein
MIVVSVDVNAPYKDPWGIMNADPPSPRPSPAADNTDTVRRHVVDVAAELMRGPRPTDFTADASDQSAMNLYLTLLMDRLPVLARALGDLTARAGTATVEENLIPVAHATVEFYSEILVAKLSVINKPDQLVQLRRALKARNFGPQRVYGRIAAYLEEERDLGRTPADLDCDASAQLLLGACVNYGFTKLLLGEVEPLDSFVEQSVRGLRLST